jgi:enediyne biosynthesis protein E4
MFSAGRGAVSPQRPLQMTPTLYHFILLYLYPTVAALFAAESLRWEQSEGFRSATLISAAGKTGFQKLAPASLGIAFTNDVSTVRGVLNRNLLNGSGVALGDMDGDGLCDIYLCGLENDNALYRNLGDWRFEDVTTSAGVACKGLDATGAVFADVDGDDDLDLLVSVLGGGVRLFHNDGKGRFAEKTKEAGLASNAASMSIALADIDGDNDLDLYVTNYRVDTIADTPTLTFTVQTANGRPRVALVDNQPATLPKWTNRFEVGPTGNVLELAEPDLFYRNDGKGKFTAVSFTDGTFLDENGAPLKETPQDWGLAVQMHDFTGDGVPDIYVCNDYYSPDRIWINDGKGKFRAIARNAIRSTSSFSMGVDFADIDRDGHFDFFVVDMLSPDHQKRHMQLEQRTSAPLPIGLFEPRLQFSRNTLQRNRGDGTFAEISYFAGVEASDWSWGPVFLDVDLDGYEDLLVTNGQLRDFQNVDMANKTMAGKGGKPLTQSEILRSIAQFPELRTPNYIFRNKGDLTFEEVGEKWGFSAPAISQGIALGDLDNDGDLDVVINNLREPPGVFRNDAEAPRIGVRLRGASPNTAGIGAKILVRGASVEQTQEIISGGRYLSGDQAMRVFSAGAANRLEVEVKWRSGKTSRISAQPNRIYEVAEEQAINSPAETPARPAPLFSEVESFPKVSHTERPSDELTRQPLLTKLLSQLGPGLCWHDMDGDGWEDLIVGSGRGGQPTLFQNAAGRSFATATNSMFNRPLARDQTTVLAMGKMLLAGSANYEDGSTNGGLVRIYDFERNAAGDSVLGANFSTGPLALADIDGDGDLDLFVGGRAVAGKYPEPADSILLKNDGGKLVPFQRFEKLGLVSGAVFSDLDSNGFPELLLATEWGPVRVFKQENGKYADRTRELGLDRFTGWWNGVATGDLNSDGQLEIVASNWGLNTAYRASAERPRKVYYGDFFGVGRTDVVEARFHPALRKEVPERNFAIAGSALPPLQERVPDFATYGKMSVQEIYGEPLTKAHALEAHTFASMIFSPAEGKFSAKPLPTEAQLAPSFAVVIGDMDGDGSEDIFLSQNFFAVAPGEPRSDAGRGLVLKGDARGDLTAMAGQVSGIKVYGEQRGAALCDFDRDGRVDLAVAQNAGPTKLFHNDKARPGLRVRVKGPAGNAVGIGAQLRLQNAQVKSAVREVQAGSGYWSQNSAVQVMTLPDGQNPTAISILWPGGKRTESPIPANAREIEVSTDGALKVIN